ncbi:alpha/beta hydrolase family protein [Niabella sp. 22666]|uniref:alpha/beta hydrolase family protein n=1 Tax=Niabella sp. 22666 TaxID=3453954 RepID=UPI003F86BF6D
MNIAPPLLLLYLCVIPYIAKSQQKPNYSQTIAGVHVNYHEDSAGNYILPDPLLLKNGRRVTTASQWTKQRRPEILSLFENLQFGKLPEQKTATSYKVTEANGTAFGGRAIRKQVTIYLSKDTSGPKARLLYYLPASTNRPSPLLLGLSFVTNAMAVDDAAIAFDSAWEKGQQVLQTSSNFKKVPITSFIDAGIGYATVYYGDIEPDFKGGLTHGVRKQFLKDGQQNFAADEWGAISAWSWGLSRVMDYLQTDQGIDQKRIALNGASRLGKTVLWTGARDTRFALIIASISGEGGAALSRRNYGETIQMITDTGRYYYQFAPNYHSFSKRVNDLPMDSHMLIALIAPRPLLLQTGNEDYFSDPKGEFLAAQAAEPVYQLLQKEDLNRTHMPLAGDTTMLHILGYYMHQGGHTILPEDYKVFIRFMQKHLMEN